jgi:L-ascorbate 6-phosphate lactonase
MATTISNFTVPRGSIGVFWFGQNGFIFKSPEGTLVSTDLYLSDSCATLRQDIDLRRQVPILLEPHEVQVDVFACTHNHQDHADPETIRELINKDTMRFIGPPPVCDLFRRYHVEDGRITQAWADGMIEHRDMRLTGTFALPTDSTDLNHLGFVLQFGDGPKVYITGDTADHELLYSAARHEPGLVITCINGGFNNLSPWQAGRLIAAVKPKLAIGCHYDMFRDNSADPAQFEAALKIQAPGTAFAQLRHGVPFLFS